MRIIVYLATKTVHLELTMNLTTGSFLNWVNFFHIGIDVVKRYILCTIRETRFTLKNCTSWFEEACMNSRSLHPISFDSKDFNLLTPGHFLIGSLITDLTYPDVTDVKMNRSISADDAATVLEIMAMQLSASSSTTNQIWSGKIWIWDLWSEHNGSSKGRKSATAAKKIGSHCGNALSSLFI